MNYKINKSTYIFMFFIAFISSVAVIVQAYYMGDIVDRTGEGIKTVLNLFIIILLTMIIEIILNAVHSYKASMQIINQYNSIYNQISKVLLNAKLEAFSKKTDGELLTIIDSDIKGINDYYRLLFGIGYIPVKLFMPLVMLFLTNWKLTICILIATPLSILPGMLISNKQYMINRSVGDAKDKLNKNFLSMISFLKIIKAYNAEKKYLYKNNEHLQAFHKNINHLDMFIITAKTINKIAGILPYLLLYLIGAFFAIRGEITVGSIISVAFYIGIFTDAIDQVQGYPQVKNRYRSSKDRIESVYNMDIGSENEIRLVMGKSDILIKLDNVSFYYVEGNDVLNNVTLDIMKGDKILTLGESGNGKTTLFRLISGLYTPVKGNVLAYTYDKNKVGDKLNISVSNQESIMLSKTVKDNILVANKELSESKFKEICEVIKLDESIYSENNADKVISDIGSNFSKGQLQRINLARTLAKDADIYLFDEPTSGLDYEMQKDVIVNILKYLSDKTVIIISHTEELKELFDKVLVISNNSARLQDVKSFILEA